MIRFQKIFFPCVAAFFLFPVRDAALCRADTTPSAPHFWNLLSEPELWRSDTGSIAWIGSKEGPILQWKVEAGKQNILQLAGHRFPQRLREYDHVRFRFRIVSGRISAMNLRILGHATGLRRGKVHDWSVAIRTTAREVDHERWFELSRPGWFPWDNPDGTGSKNFFRFVALALSPGTIIEFDRIVLGRADLFLKPDWMPPITWPELSKTNETFHYALDYRLANYDGAPAEIHARIVSDHAAFQPRFEQAMADDPRAASRRAAHGSQAKFKIIAALPEAVAVRLPVLYAEPLRVEFFIPGREESALLWQGVLVRPFGPELRTQVLLSNAEIESLRTALSRDSDTVNTRLKWPGIRKSADEFVEKELCDLPRHNQHVSNNYWGSWRPGKRMPEAVDIQTGETLFNTPLAARTWKEYMGARGNAMEHLAYAYLVLQDEKYAAKARELFTLYARNYSTLSFASLFEIDWLAGAPMLSSSRIAASSSYGSNWYMKGHSMLLSAISGSRSLTPADHENIRKNFLYAYATEILKFPAGISNMSDITHHNLTLLGLATRDATMVYYGLYRDAGLIRRLDDIHEDGFSSEGRPLNYHYAAMSEFLPALGYVERSGLQLEWPRQRLSEALKMPYRRAALNGVVPNSGDVGRGFRLGASAVNDKALAIFPNAEWLRRIAPGNGFHGVLEQIGDDPWIPEHDAWRTMLESRPRLFPNAGLGILRSGDTAETQIMATLDYGNSPMHGHRDRNAISLVAFGRIFTQGPGSLYNIGRGGMTRSDDPRLNSFIGSGSLGQNVILVDRGNQQPAMGSLLRWETNNLRQVIAARVPGIAPGVAHERLLVLEDGILTMIDRVTADKPRMFDFVYHNFGELTPGENLTASPCEPLGSTANYQNLVGPRRLVGEGPIQLRWQMDNNVNLALWQLPAGEPFLATTGINNLQTARMPDRTPSLIHRVSNREEAWFFTILEPYREKPRVENIQAAGKDGIRALIDGRWKTWKGSELMKPDNESRARQ